MKSPEDWVDSRGGSKGLVEVEQMWIGWVARCKRRRRASEMKIKATRLGLLYEPFNIFYLVLDNLFGLFDVFLDNLLRLLHVLLNNYLGLLSVVL